jgi:hypothetical protein
LENEAAPKFSKVTSIFSKSASIFLKRASFFSRAAALWKKPAPGVSFHPALRAYF